MTILGGMVRPRGAKMRMGPGSWAVGRGAVEQATRHSGHGRIYAFYDFLEWRKLLEKLLPVLCEVIGEPVKQSAK